jgi:thymidine phosphorylase
LTDTVDARVGFTQFVQVGQAVQACEPLAVVHAADQASAERAKQALLTFIDIGDAPVVPSPVLASRITDS